MKVRELVQLLSSLPNQDASVVIGDVSPNLWLFVTGVVERGISRDDANSDFAVPGRDPAVEIV